MISLEVLMLAKLYRLYRRDSSEGWPDREDSSAESESVKAKYAQRSIPRTEKTMIAIL